MKTFILFIFLIAISVSVARADVISAGADPWCPYTCDAGGDGEGLMVDVMKAAFAKAGPIRLITKISLGQRRSTMSEKGSWEPQWGLGRPIKRG